MSRGNDEARARKSKADADAIALLSALSNRGRLAPIPTGTIIQDKYRVERFIRGSDLRNQYVVTWNDAGGGRLCWECGFDQNEPTDLSCQQCHSDLGGRQFTLSERWRINFQPYYDFHEMGLFHPNLAHPYELFEDSQRLFSLYQAIDTGFLVETSSPLPTNELLRLAIGGCDLFEYLHTNGIGLASLGKEQIISCADHFIFLDPDIGAIYDDGTPDSHRLFHMEQFGRICREFTPAEGSELREIFELACESHFKDPAALKARLMEVEGTIASPPEGVAVAAMSDVGLARTLNEDSWGWERYNDDITLYTVADGMGGHDSGEIASDMAVKTILSGVRSRLGITSNPTEETLENILDQAFQEANNTVKDYSEQRRSDMGTTLVSILVYQNKTAYVANVGDSRAYVLKAGELSQISLDHSLVANLVAMGKISKSAARNHPHSNILVRTVGKEWDVEIDIFRHEVDSGDVLLLCTDGLWGEVEEDELAELICDFSDSRSACREMVRAANGHGGHDNITVLLVRFD